MPSFGVAITFAPQNRATFRPLAAWAQRSCARTTPSITRASWRRMTGPKRATPGFLAASCRADDAVVMVAEIDGVVAGYVYAGIEPLSWKELRDEAGFVHDLLVSDEARNSGVGQQLLDAAIAWLKQRGMPRVVLWTAARNAGAQRLFERRGFRSTMVEMTLELDA